MITKIEREKRRYSACKPTAGQLIEVKANIVILIFLMRRSENFKIYFITKAVVYIFIKEAAKLRASPSVSK